MASNGKRRLWQWQWLRGERERERERGDERKLKREKLKEIQIFKLGFN